MSFVMSAANALLETVYGICVVALALYGFNNLWLSAIYLLRPARKSQPTIVDEADLPKVTVQLPIYNEQHVAERLILACAQLDYPRDRLQIQVLDDSDDSTTALIYAIIQNLQQTGIDVEVVRRENRAGYKAGALAYALPYASGDFIAIFDAFCASPLGPSQPLLLVAHTLPSIGPRWALCGRAKRARQIALSLWLQRLGGHLAALLH
jgi:cellulose synthase/poly-beta-1,6-N-acetylglucosamine synthase-like glycosyltransferase